MSASSTSIADRLLSLRSLPRGEGARDDARQALIDQITRRYRCTRHSARQYAALSNEELLSMLDVEEEQRVDDAMDVDVEETDGGVSVATAAAAAAAPAFGSASPPPPSPDPSVSPPSPVIDDSDECLSPNYNGGHSVFFRDNSAELRTPPGYPKGMSQQEIKEAWDIILPRADEEESEYDDDEETPWFEYSREEFQPYNEIFAPKSPTYAPKSPSYAP